MTSTDCTILFLLLCLSMTQAVDINERNVRTDGLLDMYNPLLSRRLAVALDKQMPEKLQKFNKELRMLKHNVHLNDIMQKGIKMTGSREWFHISKKCRHAVVQVPLDLLDKKLYSVHSKALKSSHKNCQNLLFLMSLRNCRSLIYRS